MKTISTLFFLFIFCGVCGVCFADDVNINLIILIESSGNPKAYNPKSQARGLMQITPCVLKEFNAARVIIFDPNNLFLPEFNIQVGTWYINKRIPQMLKYYHIKDTIENRIRAYNSGIGTLKKGIYPKETKKYYNKYLELKEYTEKYNMIVYTMRK